jgi:drug/metabolite transporter, DME family
MIAAGKNNKGLLLVMLAGALWGTTGPLTKAIYQYGVDPLTLSLLRIGISFIALILFVYLSGRRVSLKKRHLPFFLVFGLISVALFNISYMYSIQLTTVTTAVILLYTAPAFSLLAARLVLKEALSARKLIALLLTFVGISLVVEAYLPGRLVLHLPGLLTGLGAGITYGIYGVFTKIALRRGYGTLDTVVLALGCGLFFLALLVPPWQVLPLLSEPLLLWLLLLAVAVFSTMLAYVFFVGGLMHVEAGQATLVAAVEPVMAILLAVILLGERLSPPQFVGVVLVLTAIRVQA